MSASIIFTIMQVDGHVNPHRVSSNRSKDQVKRQMNQIKSALTMKEKKELTTFYGIKETTNPLLRLPLDMCQ